MTAVTLVMALFLAAINVSNFAVSGREADRLMALAKAAVSERYRAPSPRGGVPGALSGADESMPEEPAPEAPPGEKLPDELSPERFFSVRIASDGHVLDTRFYNISSLDDVEVQRLVEAAEEDGREKGRAGDYRFVRPVNQEAGERDYIFMYEKNRRRDFMRVLVLTLLAGAVCWVLVLLLVMWMSEKAIRPVAESIEKQKQFVTDAGHEIKTPLAIIKANTDVLELHTGANKWTANIRGQTDRLASLTENLLLLSRMEEGGSRMAEEPVMAGSMLRETMRPFREPAEVRGITLSADVPGDRQILVQKDAYARLLTVFLENAVKYTKEGGFIRVSLELTRKTDSSPRGVTIRFANNCDQLPGDDPERLFDRFYRGDSSRSTKIGGSGIGLSLARAVAEGMGGGAHARYLDGNVVEFSVRL